MSADLSDEAAIRSHPLFPTLELALEACEKGTRLLADPGPADAAILEQLQDFAAANQGKEQRQATETDRLLCLAIAILRVQMAELAKVRQLCHEFCDRYIANLRSKLSQEQLLGFANDSDDETSHEASPGRDGSSPDHSLRGALSSRASRGQAKGPVATLQTPGGPVTVRLQADGLPVLRPVVSGAPAAPALFPLNGLRWPSCLPLFLPFSAPQAAAALQTLPGPAANGANGSGEARSSPPSSPPASPESNNNRKAALPQEAVDILKAWLFKHAAHPYPTDAEKRQLAVETNLNLMQVNNWFINARRRILQPLATDTLPSSTSPNEKRQLAVETNLNLMQVNNWFINARRRILQPLATDTLPSSTSPNGEESPSKRVKSEDRETGEVLPPIPRPMLTSAQRYWPFSKEPNAQTRPLDLLAQRLAAPNGTCKPSPPS